MSSPPGTNFAIYDMSFKKKKITDDFPLYDGIGGIKILDTRGSNVRREKNEDIEDLPKIIKGSYEYDYNIIYVDTIIRKKLNQEKKLLLYSLKEKYKLLDNISKKPQTYIMRDKTLHEMENLQKEITEIETGERIRKYEELVGNLIEEYKIYRGDVKTISFTDEKVSEGDLDEKTKIRLFIIEKYLEIARQYIEIDVSKKSDKKQDVCALCNHSLEKVSINMDGNIICPNPECGTEYNMIISIKHPKDGSRSSNSNVGDDDSIDNFIKAFNRYQGLQLDLPDENIYNELDEYFRQCGRPTREEILQLPLNSRGRRGDTNHKMLLTALSKIGRPNYYEDVNLIGKIYWGWTLPDVSHFKEKIISDYMKTQKVFHEIPIEERDRFSSLGTQYRLWRHLQLVGHDCHMDEFKMAENKDSITNHNRIWKIMCDNAGDPSIYYIK